MLPRVLEPEAMDTPEEARVYDAMDHSEVNARFVEDFHKVHGACRGGDILDLGTGTARIPILLCEADPGAWVVAVDLSESMLDLARQNVLEAGLEGRITLRRMDAKATVEDSERYEAVVSNSIIHHIPEPGGVFAEMVRLLAGGGTLFVRDLARPSSREQLEQLVQTYAGEESEHARTLFSDSLHAALTVEEVRDLVGPLGIPADATRKTSDRHWTLAWKRPAE